MGKCVILREKFENSEYPKKNQSQQKKCNFMFLRLFVLRTTSLRLNELMKQEVFLAVPMDEREKFIAFYRVDDLVGTLPSP